MATVLPPPRTLPPSRIPPALRQRADADPAFTVTVRGNPDLLTNQPIGFFCSQSSPGDAILNTYDLALALRDTNLTFIGGFQSPMEKEFLTFVLRGTASVIICPARGIARMRLPAAWRTPLETNRLLLLSCFPDNIHRPTHQTATNRNALVANLATSLLVPHATPGGKVEHLCRAALTRGTAVFTASPGSSRLSELGATELRIDALPNLLTAATGPATVAPRPVVGHGQNERKA